MRHWLWLTGLLFFQTPGLADSELNQALNSFSQGLSSYRAQFEQLVVDASGRELENSTGNMALMAPDRFRWHYLTPYEQLIVADGEQVWIHDVDLEQVTVKSQGDATTASPLSVLTNPAGLEQRYRLEDRGQFHESRVIGLIPLDQNSEFESVELVLRDQLLEAINIQDRFGQQTRIRFLRPQRNPDIPTQEFQFEPPPGIDVIGEADLEFGLEGS
jgi:outer membrane lipoprotein carrier protein